MRKRKILLSYEKGKRLILTDATEERIEKVWNCCPADEAVESLKCTSFCLELYQLEPNDKEGREIAEAIGYEKCIEKQTEERENDMRMISLMDGTGMGATTIIFQTDAPRERLCELERVSNEVYQISREMDEVPIWSDVLSEEGYRFVYVVEKESPEDIAFWLEEKGVTEQYVIDDQCPRV